MCINTLAPSHLLITLCVFIKWSVLNVFNVVNKYPDPDKYPDLKKIKYGINNIIITDQSLHINTLYYFTQLWYDLSWHKSTLAGTGKIHKHGSVATQPNLS